MKKFVLPFLFSAIAACTAWSQTGNQNQAPTGERKIQMAILFDASGSMDGLLSQAKARMWSIVNELTELRFNAIVPTVEIGLYSYGNDGHPSSEMFVKQLVPLTTDLDLISQKLFSITTNGGSEYCGGVISKALSDLAWSTAPEDLKMIYIAGNEPFNQGPIDYKTICASACSREIFVNTIHCGPYEQGVKDFWFDGATKGCGDYFHIDSDASVQHIPTPYDSVINVLNDSLNNTYFGYGVSGVARKEMQAKEDENAASMGAGNKAERSAAKSKANYSNAEWDMVDAQKQGKLELEKLKDEELPKEFRGKTLEEKKAILANKEKERTAYQKQIAELAKEREKFIAAEKAKMGGEAEDDFGSSISKSIEKKSQKIGYSKVIH